MKTAGHLTGLSVAFMLAAAVVPVLAHDAERTAPALPPAMLTDSVQPEEVRFPSGDLTLGGQFFTPDAEGPFPTAVFIRGSGPSRRGNYWTMAFVNVLLARGVAVLLPDKRGSDASEGDWRTADFDDLAEDALAGVSYARSRADVARDRVGLVGLSQGGKIAPLAAAGSDAVAFVINVVGSATGLREQVGWEMYYTFREAGVEGAALEEGLRLQVLAEGYLEGVVDWDTYASARLAAMSGPGAPVAEGFPATPDAWQWDFFRGVRDVDPLPAWKNVTQPVLVLYGEDDHNAPTISSAYRLIRVWREMNHPDAAVRIIPGAGHALWDPASDRHRPALHPEVVRTLEEWLAARIRHR